ncbi:MAG: hypothetical protein IT240_04195 [Bacteroidia bacterium]|nr:hypothetical protein [Bacteroidia bacterium]
MTQFKPFWVTLLLSVVFIKPVVSQESLSPYSRFGIGHISNGSQPVISSLGNAGAAFSDSATLNLSQPASLASLGAGLVILEAGFTGSVGQYSFKNQTGLGTTAGFGYLALAVPIVKNRWVTSFSLTPISSAAFALIDTLNYPGGVPVEVSSSASGGYSKLSFANALRLTKNFTIGVGLHYVFGRMDYNTQSRFPNDPNIRSSAITKTNWLNGLDYNAGIQHQIRFHRPFNWERDSIGRRTGKRIYKSADSLHLISGFCFSPTHNINGREGVLARSYLNNLQFLDTLYYSDQTKGTMVMPMNVALSFALKHSRDKWLVIAEAAYTDWNRFRKFGIQDSVRSSYSLSIGGQWHPRPESMYSSWQNYFQRIKYRAGFYYSDGYLKPQGTPLAEMGCSIGFGLPFSWKTYAGKKATHSINLSLSASQRGFLTDSQLKEQIIKASIAITFNDRWFHKRQYE